MRLPCHCALGLVLWAWVPTLVQAQAAGGSKDTSVRPFRVHVPDEALTDLRRRLVATR